MSLDSLKRRLKTVKSTGKITKAMSLISAAQLKNVKKSSSSYENYSEFIHNLTFDLAAKLAAEGEFGFSFDGGKVSIPDSFVIKSINDFFPAEDPELEDDKFKKKGLIIAITSEKGLCGSFNNAVVSKVCQIANRTGADILCIGKKGYDSLSKLDKYHILKNSHIEMDIKHSSSEVVMRKITSRILRLIESGKYSFVQIVSTEFVSMLKQDVKVHNLFPLVIESSTEGYGNASFDDEKENLLKNLLPHYMHSVVYQIVLDSLKSETSKRMLAMDSASTNCKGMVDTLTLKYNRARQTKVTMELIEVISGMQ